MNSVPSARGQREELAGRAAGDHLEARGQLGHDRVKGEAHGPQRYPCARENASSVERRRRGAGIEAEQLWYDRSRWASWIDGFASSAEARGRWPLEGARRVWDHAARAAAGW